MQLAVLPWQGLPLPPLQARILLIKTPYLLGLPIKTPYLLGLLTASLCV